MPSRMIIRREDKHDHITVIFSLFMLHYMSNDKLLYLDEALLRIG